MQTDVAIIGGSIAALRAAHECARSGVPWLLLVAEDHLGDGTESLRRGGCVLDHRPAIIGGDEEEWVSWDESILAGVGPTPPMVVRFRHAGQFHEMADPLRHPLASTLSRWRGLFGSGLGASHWSAIARLSQMASAWHRSKGNQTVGDGEETVDEMLDSASSPRSLAAAVLPLVRMLGLDPLAAGSARGAARAWRGGSFGPAIYETGLSGLLDHVGAGLPVLDDELSASPSGVLMDHPVTRLELTHDGATLRVGDDEIRAHAVVVATANRPWEHADDVPDDAVRPPTAATIHYLLPAKSLPSMLAGGALVVSDEAGPINHIMATSDVAPGCAPAGRALVSCTVVDPGAVALGDVGVDRAVRAQLEDWLGARSLSAWRTAAVQRSHRAPDASGDGVLVDATGTLIDCDRGALCGPLVGQVRAGRLAARRALELMGLPGSPPRPSN